MSANKAAKKEIAPALTELEKAWVCGYAYGYASGGGDFDYDRSLPKRLRAYATKHSNDGCEAIGCDLFPKAKP